MSQPTTQLRFRISFTVIMEGARANQEQELEVSEAVLLPTLEAIQGSKFVVQSTIKIQPLN